jgi:hypothetical protein
VGGGGGVCVGGGGIVDRNVVYKRLSKIDS